MAGLRDQAERVELLWILKQEVCDPLTPRSRAARQSLRDSAKLVDRAAINRDELRPQ